MWLAGEHHIVDAPTLLTYTERVTDDAGTPPPDSSDTEVRVALTWLPDGRTHVTMTHTGLPADSPGATGWQMALDELAAALAH